METKSVPFENLSENKDLYNMISNGKRYIEVKSDINSENVILSLLKHSKNDEWRIQSLLLTKTEIKALQKCLLEVLSYQQELPIRRSQSLPTIINDIIRVPDIVEDGRA